MTGDGATTTIKKSSEIPFSTDGLGCPSIYADAIRGATVINGMVKLNLVELKINALTKEPSHVHVATIVVPSAQMEKWASLLSKMAKNISSDDEGDE